MCRETTRSPYSLIRVPTFALKIGAYGVVVMTTSALSWSWWAKKLQNGNKRLQNGYKLTKFSQISKIFQKNDKKLQKNDNLMTKWLQFGNKMLQNGVRL